MLYLPSFDAPYCTIADLMEAEYQAYEDYLLSLHYGCPVLLDEPDAALEDAQSLHSML